MVDTIDINLQDNIRNSRYNEKHESSSRFRKNPVVLEKLKNEELFDILFELNKDIIKDYKVNKIRDDEDNVINAIYYKIPINYSKELTDLMNDSEQKDDDNENKEYNDDNKEYNDKEEEEDEFVTIVFFIKTTYNEHETTLTIENINNGTTEKILIHDKNNMEYLFNFKIFTLSLNASHEKWYDINTVIHFDDDINKINKFKQKLFFKKISELFNRFEKYCKNILKNDINNIVEH